MGDARLELTPLRPGTRPYDGRAGWAAALAKPAALGIAAVSVALCGGALALLWLAPAHHPYSYDVSGDLVVGSLFPLAGALIAVREPGNRCSWVLLSTGLVAVSAFSHEWAHDGLARPGSLPLVPVAVWLAGWTFAPYWLQVSLLPVFFPDGKIPSRRWRRFVAAVLIVIAAATVVAMFTPDSMSTGSASATRWRSVQLRSGRPGTSWCWARCSYSRWGPRRRPSSRSPPGSAAPSDAPGRNCSGCCWASRLAFSC
ncbi:MAG: hypothetical protein M3Z75_11025 [Actinomycetota bacterium]|nr:hypothetical protein [Actinomycetota bacterium]